MSIPKQTFSHEYKILDNEEAEFYIINKKKEKFIVLLDKEDLERLIQFNKPWHVAFLPNSQSYYVVCSEYLERINGKSKYKTHYLHRWIFNYPKGILIDHFNHDTLDNRKNNLRLTAIEENSSHRKGANKNNGTGHRNVNWGWDREFYYVQFMKNGERFQWKFPLNQFDEACEFADIKRKELFGEFAG